MRMTAIGAVMLSLTLWTTTAPPASAESADQVHYVVFCAKQSFDGVDTVRTIKTTRGEAINVAIECVKTGGTATVVNRQ